MTNPDPAPVRDAASLLVLKEIGAAPQVLMGMRGANHKFMPNHLVFPGGAVDPDDGHSATHALPPQNVLARLDPDPIFARALAYAAARELDEETGLHLGQPPDLSGFDYLCRAITPEGSPIRFDARFLIVDAALLHGTLAGSGELEDLSWYGVGEALALDLSYPTRKVMEQLHAWLALDDEARNARSKTPTLRERSWNME
jgi:8-oxo-dGTP pyrophosphatase MutT (NUDIX family)